MRAQALANTFNIVTDFTHAIYVNPPLSTVFKGGSHYPLFGKDESGNIFNKCEPDCKPKAMHAKNDLIDTPRENATMFIHIHHRWAGRNLKGLS
jgi:hypothetical protein